MTGELVPCGPTSCSTAQGAEETSLAFLGSTGGARLWIIWIIWSLVVLMLLVGVVVLGVGVIRSVVRALLGELAWCGRATVRALVVLIVLSSAVIVASLRLSVLEAALSRGSIAGLLAILRRSRAASILVVWWSLRWISTVLMLLGLIILTLGRITLVVIWLTTVIGLAAVLVLVRV